MLIDVSRIVWRRWTGTRATGIDRICQAWLEEYAAFSQAVIIHRYGKSILPQRASRALFDILLDLEQSGSSLAGRLLFRRRMVATAMRHGMRLRDQLDGRGRFWLNPGHTGLDAPEVAIWARRRHLRPIHLVHDLIPITHPQFCREGEDERHRRRMRTVLDTASGVVTNSAHTLEALREFAAAEKRPLPPVAVAWPGTSVLPSVSEIHGAEPTFVVLGTIEGRKNHALLLSLWRQLLKEGNEATVPRLVIVGRRGWQADDVFSQLDRRDFDGRVIELGSLDDRDLASVLAGSRALLFPSCAEGYGIPLAEALAAGVPVIASDLPVFREIGQGIPELLPADDLALWRKAVCDYAREPSPRRSAQLSRMQKFRAPDWRGHFARVDALLDAIGR
jgi:glycosyltransferase involved in cell wall biosynthesis